VIDFGANRPGIGMDASADPGRMGVPSSAFAAAAYLYGRKEEEAIRQGKEAGA
jgi:hypothetical protein